MDITEEILSYSLQMAQRIAARAVMVYADVFASFREIRSFLQESGEQSMVMVTRGRENMQRLQEAGVEAIQVPNLQLTRMGQIKIAILLGLSQGKFQRGDRLVCLTGTAEKKSLDTIVFIEVGQEHEMFAGARLDEISAHLTPEVFERVLDIAVSLGAEGREGKPVGTIFVIGDADNVLAQSIPLVLNPFKGHLPEERNVLDPSLAETVKEFATIDGAFIIRGDGLIEAAGIYLKPIAQGERLPLGLGTRHMSASDITASTNAVAIVVSESTGNVTVFRGGKMFIEVERLRKIEAQQEERKQ